MSLILAVETTTKNCSVALFENEILICFKEQNSSKYIHSECLTIFIQDVMCKAKKNMTTKGFLEFVNDSHIHDLGKFMFGFSVFWTYLWFSQFMLIWYSNIPEEVTYFMTRIEDYNLPFFGMLVMNFIFPLLILMNSDYKRINYFIVMAGIVILLGHYIDVYNMIMPSAVGDQWYIGAAEIGGFLFFLGLFIFIVFKELTKSSLFAKGDPYIGESKRFHY